MLKMGRILGLISPVNGIKNSFRKKIAYAIRLWIYKKNVSYIKVVADNNIGFYRVEEKEELIRDMKNIKGSYVLIGFYSKDEIGVSKFNNLVSDSLFFTKDGLKYAPAFEEKIHEIFSQTNRFSDLLTEMDSLDSNFSVIIVDKRKFIIKRDKLGVKPLWFSFKDGHLILSSERKVLYKFVQSSNVSPLIPRDAIIVDNDKMKFIKEISEVNYKFYNEYKSEEEIIESMHEFMINAIKKRIPPNGKVTVLFSGGVDSTAMAILLKKVAPQVYGISVGFERAKDLEFSLKAAEKINLKLYHKIITDEDLNLAIPNAIFATEEFNPIRVSVATTFYLANTLAKNKGFDIVFSGTGSEEIFAGYQKYLELRSIGLDFVHEATIYGLRNIWIRDLYRDDTIAFHSGVVGVFPYLDKDLVDFSMKIHPKYKVSESEKKVIFRKYAEWVGVPKEIAWRPKIAAQYGSGMVKGLRRYIKKKGYQHIIDMFYTTYKKIFKEGKLL